MRKSTKLMVALGVVAGVGVAALPLGGTSALTPTADTSDDKTDPAITLTANVDVAYAIQASTPDPVSVIPNGDVATTTGTVTAAANGKYKVTATSSALKLGGTSSDNDIPTATDSVSVAQGTSAWGIKGGDLGTDDYTGLGGDGAVLQAKTGASADDGDVINVTYGVSADANQSSGQYTTSVTYTIAANS